MPPFDVAFLGGGLHAGLCALALSEERPDWRVAVVEASSQIGGNHLWSFHQGDAPDPLPSWLAELVECEWPGYEVRFPGQRRTIEQTYRTMTSERLHQALTARADRSTCQLFVRSRVVSATEHTVTLDDGQTLRARLILDGRGLRPSGLSRAGGYQKFCGSEVHFREPHGIDLPVLMDATVEQLDGFRFVYLLPFSERRLFVEDTYFSDSGELDQAEVRERIVSYARTLGAIEHIGRQESGVLPMPWRELPGESDSLRALGVRGGWYHPATAYSVPCALRVAQAVASAATPEAIVGMLAELRTRHRRQARFARLLNFMLFRCYPPAQRVHVFAKFYRLPEATIERFYSLELSNADRLRILSGRPPRGFSIRHAAGMEASA